MFKRKEFWRKELLLKMKVIAKLRMRENKTKDTFFLLVRLLLRPK